MILKKYPASILVPRKIHAHHQCRKKIHARSVIETKKVCYTKKKIPCIRMHTRVPRKNFLVHVRVRIKICAGTISHTHPLKSQNGPPLRVDD